jgi:hypothetical protein
MEKTKEFFKSETRDNFSAWARDRGFWTNCYQYIAGGLLIYVCKYWK